MEELFQAFIDIGGTAAASTDKSQIESHLEQMVKASTSKRLTLIPDIDQHFEDCFKFFDNANEFNEFCKSLTKSLREITSTAKVDYFTYRLAFCKTGGKDEHV